MDDAIQEWFERVDFRLKCELPGSYYKRVIKILFDELQLILEEEKARLAKTKEGRREIF